MSKFLGWFPEMFMGKLYPAGGLKVVVLTVSDIYHSLSSKHPMNVLVTHKLQLIPMIKNEENIGERRSSPKRIGVDRTCCSQTGRRHHKSSYSIEATVSLESNPVASDPKSSFLNSEQHSQAF